MHDILQNCMQAEKLHGRVTPNAQVFVPLWDPVCSLVTLGSSFQLEEGLNKVADVFV